MAKSSRMLQLLNHRLRIVTQDGKSLVGQMIAFDKHMNLVLADCNEYRIIKPKKSSQEKERTEKRHMGLVILRGEEVVSFVVESGPPPSAQDGTTAVRVPASMSIGGAVSRQSAVRGPMPLGAPMPGLSGPVRGVGGSAPYVTSQPISYGRPMPPSPMMPGMPPMMPPPGGPMPGMPPMMPGMPPMMPGMPPMMPGMQQPSSMPGMQPPPMPGMPFPPPPPSSSQPPAPKH